jgi:probable phosphoglycerate mutase
MLTLYLVRHGQTALSRANTFCGATDAPLTDAGRAMAEALGARYGAVAWRGIYASPLQRARDTAAPVAARAGLPVAIDADLREIAYGAWEGREESEVAASDPEAFRAWAQNPGHVAPPGGETGFQIAARAMAALERIRARHDGGNVLVVSHKATLRVLLCALLGIDVNLFRARVAKPVASVSIVEWKASGPLLARLGDVSHLPPELAGAEGT